MLAGDALLAEAFRLALAYESPAVARELAEATLGMIGGQYLDTMVDGYDLAAVHRLKTGRLFYASVTMALWAAELPEEEQAPWRAFAEELGLLFQIVDDILDADGYVRAHGAEAARRYADEAAERARARLAAIDADTAVLARDRRRARRPHGVTPVKGRRPRAASGVGHGDREPSPARRPRGESACSSGRRARHSLVARDHRPGSRARWRLDGVAAELTALAVERLGVARRRSGTVARSSG